MAIWTLLQTLGYGAAAALYLVYLLGAKQRAASAARWTLLFGAAAHLIDIAARCLRGVNPLSSSPEAMSFVAFLVAVGFLLGLTRFRLAAAGAFATPAILILVVLARVVPEETEGVRMGALGMVHVFLAIVGVALFALAAVLSLLYLVEDRQLKAKQFGKLLGRETPLATLDRLTLRCVSFGFPIFTVSLITGAVWVARLGQVQGHASLRPEYLFAVTAWTAFGALLLARIGAGWQGRKAAWLTLGGFGSAVVVLAVYLFRHAA